MTKEKESVEETFADQFPVVEKMTVEQKKQEFQIYLKRLNEKIDLFNYRDNELIELLDAVCGAIHWLKDEHEKEGLIDIDYKRKKNVRGDAESKIIVSVSFKRNLNETDTETLDREFLAKSFLVEKKK